MANITYNGLSNPQGLITFSDVPNILKVKDDNGGTRASITINVNQNISSVVPTSDGEYFINLFGNTITNALSPQTLNKSFYIAPTPQATAAYIARALRNCPNVVANFNVYNVNSEVKLVAYDQGAKLSNLEWSTNLPPITESHIEGGSSSRIDRALINANIYVNNQFATSLEKNFYNGECAFNLSPFLTSISTVGRTVPYFITVTYLKDGDYGTVGIISPQNATIGYMVNQGARYLVSNDFTFAQNTMRDGKQMTLYTYYPTIILSAYMTINHTTLGIKYLDSAYNEIGNERITVSKDETLLKDMVIELDSELFNQAFYVDVIYNEENAIRYNVIKPIKAAEDVTRVYWRNSYGGRSFFDFTAQKSETRDVEIETYERGIFDYYETDANVQKMIYSNNVEYEVTLKSHLMEESAKYLFNEILQSPKVWTNVNGETYDIILKSVSVDEVQNGVYQATIKYNYSQNPSSI